MLFVRFWACSQKNQNGNVFVDIEGFRPCLSKPSYRAPKWALMIRLMQKERLKLFPRPLHVAVPNGPTICPLTTARAQITVTRLRFAEGHTAKDRPRAKAAAALGTCCGHSERRAHVRNAPRAAIERAHCARPAGAGGAFRNEDANSGLPPSGSTDPPPVPRVRWL